MMVRAYSSAEASWSLASMVLVRWGPSKLPLASLTLAEAMAERTSAMVSPAEARAEGLTCTRTAGRCPPDRVTRPTPVIRYTWRTSARPCSTSRVFGASIPFMAASISSMQS